MSAEPLEGPRVRLTPPLEADCDAFIAAMRASRALHQPWVFPPLDEEGYRRFVKSAGQPGEAVFVARTAATDQICGVVGLNLIVYRALCSASLSYYGVLGHHEKGLMREALTVLIRHGFEDLGLNRIEANIQPNNVRSIELARGLGFRREGFSPRYLNVGGQWRDHVRWALLHDQF